MGRFFIPENRIRVQNEGTLLAFFSFVDNDTGLEYQDWRLIDGKNGPFAASPSGKPYTPKGSDKAVYPSLVQPSWDKEAKNNRNPKGVAFMTALTTAAYEAYQAKSGVVQSTAARSGRGPVPSPASRNDYDESDLPF